MRGRLHFLDALRGFALILMVFNHTSHDWIDRTMGWPGYYLTYGSLLLPAPIFLFLVGFVLPISIHRAPARDRFAGAVAKYFRRGIVIIGAGLLLNLLVLRDRAVTSGGVLQTIGLCIVLLGPAMPLLRSRAARWGMLVVAALIYLSFARSYPALVRWSDVHPAVARTLFADFPPWPWLGAALIGLVLGWTWLEARSRSEADEERFFTRVALASVLALAAAVVWEWQWPSTPPFGFPRDYILNHHWTPRGATLVFVIGGVGGLLVAFWWLAERRRWHLSWLVIFGQTALMLYFVHQLIEWTLVRQRFGLKFNDWILYLVMNLMLLLVLVLLGQGWLMLKPWARDFAARQWVALASWRASRQRAS